MERDRGRGSRWLYRHRGAGADWNEEVKINESEDGVGVVLSDTPGPSGTHSDSLLYAGADAVCRVSKEVFAGTTLEATAEYDPGFIRFSRDWLEAEIGLPEEVTYQRREYDARGVLLRDGDRTHEYTVEARDETVTVPAGEFTSCLRVLRDRVRGAGEPEMEDDEKRFWFCPGVGKVREEEPLGTKVEELLECEVPGGRCD